MNCIVHGVTRVRHNRATFTHSTGIIMLTFTIALRKQYIHNKAYLYSQQPKCIENKIALSVNPHVLLQKGSFHIMLHAKSTYTT